MTRQELINWVRRKLGEPMVRVELHDSQIEDCIYTARDEYIKWSAGGSTDEVFFSLALSAGVDEYDLPSGVTEVVKVKELDTSSQGINTLFSTENYLYNTGVLSFLHNIGDYSMIDYHLALSFIELMDRYMPSYYSWRYNNTTNKIRVRPTPSLDTQVGYLIIHSFMLVGTDERTFTEIDDAVYNQIWNNTWVKDYSLACAKQTLGMIRRKFANFSSIGNEGISLDGDALISEANDEKEKLEEKIRLDEYSEMGYGITMG